MGLSVNKAMVLGNVGRDPEVRSFSNGGKVANLTVATSRKWKNRNTGEIQERTEWHRINVTAEPAVRYVEQYVRKGDAVFVEGRIETRKWQDQSGQDRFSTEIVVAPYEGNIGHAGRASSRDDGPAGSGGGGGGYGRTDDRTPPDHDDEIPF